MFTPSTLWLFRDTSNTILKLKCTQLDPPRHWLYHVILTLAQIIWTTAPPPGCSSVCARCTERVAAALFSLTEQIFTSATPTSCGGHYWILSTQDPSTFYLSLQTHSYRHECVCLTPSMLFHRHGYLLAPQKNCPRPIWIWFTLNQRWANMFYFSQRTTSESLN